MASVQNFHIGIKAVIVKNGKVLVLKDPRFVGYDLPGGKIDKREKIEEALKRELHEELGLQEFEIGELLYVFERKDYKEKDIGLMLIFYRVKANISDIKLSDEHTEFEWISKSDLHKTKNFRNNGVKVALEKVFK